MNDPKSSEQAVEEVLSQTGKIDVLVNNAGIGGGASIEELPEELLRSIFETNFFGAMRMMRLVLPAMRQARSGAIVNISSIAGRLANARGSAYSGSKFALEAASESLALEVRRFNIRVVIIEPGFTRTPIFEKGGPKPDPNSPYHAFNLRGERLTATMIPNASPPELVAEAIQHSLETDDPKLRYPVGEDANAWAVGRRAMTDEDWVNFGREMTLDEYAQFYRDRLGTEI